MNRHDVPQQNNSSLATGTGSQHLAQTAHTQPVLPTCLIPPTYFRGTFVPIGRVLGYYNTSRVPTALPSLCEKRNPEEKAALEGGITTVLNNSSVAPNVLQPHIPKPYSSTDFQGMYKFDIQFEEEKYPPTKSAPWTYSPSLEKLFARMQCIVPIRIRLQVFPPVPGCYVKVVVIFKQPEYYREIVERCPNHITYNQDGHCAPKHLLRCENTKTSYITCPETGRHCLFIPLDAPQAGCDFVTEMFKFMCFSSCQGGVNRRPILVVFTLEYNNIVVGRKAQNVRICASPGRDRTSEESRNASLHSK